MPLYAYRCPTGHNHDARKSVDKRDTSVACPQCGKLCKRSLARFLVNWNGLPPSRGGVSPLVNEFADERNRQARIEKSIERHEERIHGD